MEFAERVQAAGYTLNGESRLILLGGENSSFEVQLGID
jgi:hypothetical protein